MPQTTIIGGGNLQPGSQAAVDPLYQAFRISQRPLDYSNIGQLLGHYAVAQSSGAMASIGAGGHVASIRWADSTRFMVLMRIRAGWEVVSAITAATPMDLQAVVARGFSVDFTTASTAANLASPSNTNKMRSSMGSSLMGAAGPRIGTTTVMSGQTLTADANPFAMTNWVNQPSGNAIVTQAVGVGGAMQTVYEVTAQGQHPIVLTTNEGVILQPVTAGPVTGTMKYLVVWEWAEILVY